MNLKTENLKYLSGAGFRAARLKNQDPIKYGEGEIRTHVRLSTKTA